MDSLRLGNPPAKIHGHSPLVIFGLVTHESEIVIKPTFLGDPSTKSRGVSFGITKEERPHCPRSLNRRELPLQFSDFLIHIPAFKCQLGEDRKSTRLNSRH